jgi:hypothetical protein
MWRELTPATWARQSVKQAEGQRNASTAPISLNTVPMARSASCVPNAQKHPESKTRQREVERWLSANTP